MKDRLIEAYGWYGIVAILLAYALNAFGLIPSDGLRYSLLNLTGSIGVVAVSLKKRNSQPAALNAIWAVVAAVALVRLFV